MTSNPWVRLAAVARPPVASDGVEAVRRPGLRTPSAVAPRRPQPRLEPPPRVLPRWTPGTPGRFVLGVHGGSGESLLAGLLGWQQAHHRWPVWSDRPLPHSAAGVPASALVVLTCRSDLSGLEAARAATREWAASSLPGVDLVGLVIVADAPVRLPRPLASLAAVVAGGVPHCWQLPWLPQLRVGARPHPHDPAVRGLVRDVKAAADEAEDVDDSSSRRPASLLPTTSSERTAS